MTISTKLSIDFRNIYYGSWAGILIIGIICLAIL